MKRLIFLAVILLFVGLLGGVFWFYVRNISYLGNKQPFFVSGPKSRIGGVLWDIGEFQPSCGKVSQKEGDIYMRCAYRDNNKMIREVELFMGRVLDGGNIELYVGLTHGQKDRLDVGITLEQLKALFSKNAQVKVAYLISDPNYSNLKGSKFCVQLAGVCKQAELVEKYSDFYTFFEVSKKLPNGVALPAIMITVPQ